MVCHVVLFIVVPRARGRASGSLLQGVDGSTIWVLPIMLDSNNHRGSGPSGSLSESYCESDRIRTVASRHDWIPDVLLLGLLPGSNHPSQHVLYGSEQR